MITILDHHQTHMRTTVQLACSSLDGSYVQHVYVSRVMFISKRAIECIIWFISTGRREVPLAALGSCSTCTGLILVRTAASSGLLEGAYTLSITAIKAQFQIIKKHYVRRCHCLCVA